MSRYQCLVGCFICNSVHICDTTALVCARAAYLPLHLQRKLRPRLPLHLQRKLKPPLPLRLQRKLKPRLSLSLQRKLRPAQRNSCRYTPIPPAAKRDLRAIASARRKHSQSASMRTSRSEKPPAQRLHANPPTQCRLHEGSHANPPTQCRLHEGSMPIRLRKDIHAKTPASRRLRMHRLHC